MNFLGCSKSSNFIRKFLLILKWENLDKDIDSFDKEFKESIELETVLTKNNKNHLFITSIINYFNLEFNLYYENKLTNKDISKK